MDLEELEKFLQLLGKENVLVSLLGHASEQLLWDLLREILLELRSREPSPPDESPMKRGLGYMYTLVRAIECLERFPTPEEMGRLLESSRYPHLEGWKAISEILRDCGDEPSARAARRRLRERRRRYRG